MQTVMDAFTQINSTLLPFVATTPQGHTFTPYSQLTNVQRANITSAAYNLAAQVMAAAAALKADNVRPSPSALASAQPRGCPQCGCMLSFLYVTRPQAPLRCIFQKGKGLFSAAHLHPSGVEASAQQHVLQCLACSLLWELGTCMWTASQSSCILGI